MVYEDRYAKAACNNYSHGMNAETQSRYYPC